jgi:serine/threonine protein kinase
MNANGTRALFLQARYPAGVDAAKIPAGLPRPGDTVAGKYAIVRVIGEGGMGVVYEATHLRLRRRVAVKMLLPYMLATSSDLVARFEREARAAGQLRDKHITKVLDVDTTSEGVPYLVMEYLEGHDLEAELIARGPLPIGEAVGYVLQVCGAMTEAHAAGIVHRDLKPSNLFLTPDRDGWLVKVLDFGISKMADEKDAKLTGTQTTVGTPLYMSPEQVRSSRNVDSRSDVWSLGVILYELLAGRTPFEGSTTAAAAAIVADPTPPLQEFRPDVPQGLQKAIHHALCKDSKSRCGTVAEFAQSIAPFASTIRPSMMPMSAAPVGAPSAARPTPTPSTPSYPRAPESAGTLIAEAAPESPSGPSLAPATTGSGQGRTTRRGLVAAGAAGVLLVIAVVLAISGRGAAPHPAASTPAEPVASASTAARAPSGKVENPPAPAAAGDVPSELVATAPSAKLPTSRPPVQRSAVAPVPAAPRPPSKAAASPSVVPLPTHGSANPLYL